MGLQVLFLHPLLANVIIVRLIEFAVNKAVNKR